MNYKNHAIFAFSIVLFLYSAIISIFIFFKHFAVLDSIIYSGHLIGSLVVTLQLILPCYILLLIVVRIHILNASLIETIKFRKTRTTFKVKMVCNQTMQNKLIQNASLIFLNIDDIISLLNSVFGFLVSMKPFIVLMTLFNLSK